MNPYDFVRIDWTKEVQRRPAVSHDRFTEGLCGHMEGTITTLTPFFIPHTEDLKHKDTRLRSNYPITFARNTSGQYILPGSSLKGLFRSLVETLGPGCWWLYDGRYRDNVDYTDELPRAFKQCAQADSLCIACRLFGLINSNTLRLGQVGFEDAVCDAPIPYHPIYTPILDTPKPRHRAWYLEASGDRVAGRKFFFHADKIRTEGQLKASKQGEVLNQYIHPIGKGSMFTFSAHFNNIKPDEWPTLLYALTLERKDWGHGRDVRHKMGYAKPAGLGSIEVQLTKLTLVDYRQRYTASDRGTKVYEAHHLRDYINNQIQPLLNANTITLQDLRRIWSWPPAPGVAYRYPDRNWFNTNPNTPISHTP